MRHTSPAHSAAKSPCRRWLRMASSWLVVAALCGVSSASASEKSRIKSRFTTVELKSCAPLKADGAATGPAEAKIEPKTEAWVCQGLSGYPVTILNEKHQQFISFGANGHMRRAATQALSATGSIFGPSLHRATIEWRFRRNDGRDVPYAAIVRVYASGGKVPGGDMLIVTKITPAEACHMARIDARSTPDAMILARSAADDLSAGFDCRHQQPRVISNRRED
jgi:hypothetical protein